MGLLSKEKIMQWLEATFEHGGTTKELYKLIESGTFDITLSLDSPTMWVDPTSCK